MTSSSVRSRNLTAWTGSVRVREPHGASTRSRPRRCPASFDFDERQVTRVTPLLAATPKLETTPASRRSPTRSTRRPCGATAAHHVGRLQVHVGPDRERQGHLRQDRLRRRSSRSTTPDPKTAVVTFKEPYPGWRDLFGALLRHLPEHLLEGKDRNASDEGRLHVLRWPVDPGPLDEGRRRSSSSRTPSTGTRCRTLDQHHVQAHRGHGCRPVPGVQDRVRSSMHLPAGRSLARSSCKTASRASSSTRSRRRQRRGAVAQQRPRSRSTSTCRCARPSPTRSTVTPS